MFDFPSISPGLYRNWLAIKDAPEPFHFAPDPQAVADLEALAGGRLPEDYRHFLLRYSDVGGSVKTGVRHFRCLYPRREIIEADFGMVSSARQTLKSTKRLSQPHRTLEHVGPRIPESMLATGLGKASTFLIDLRPDSFGRVYYIEEVKLQTFGTPGYDWNNVGLAGESFSDFMAGVGTLDEVKARHPRVRAR